jgi:hypothetical protein
VRRAVAAVTVVVCTTLLLATTLALRDSATRGQSPGGVLLQDDFSRANGRNGVITNSYALFNRSNPRSVSSPVWEMTAGSLFSHNGVGWTGPPDLTRPNADSSNGTGSAVFRLRTHRADFRNVAVRVRMRVLRWTPTVWPKQLPTVVVWVRYKTEQHLYWPSVLSSDGRVDVNKKVPGGPHPANGGTYLTLPPFSTPPNWNVDLGRWYDVGVRACNKRDGSVTITVSRDGQGIVTARDRGKGQVVTDSATGRRVRDRRAPLSGPGRVGIRADNAEVEFTQFQVVDAQSQCNAEGGR